METERHKTLLGLLIEQHPWTQHEFIEAYNEKARELDETTSLSPRQLARWLADDLARRPLPAARRVLRHMFGRPAEELLAPPDASRSGLDHSQAEQDLVMAAAHESRDHAMDAAAVDVSPIALENMYDDIVGLARCYHTTPPTELLSEALRVRNDVYRLLEQTKRPTRTSDLYLLAGHACVLMASASFDLGHPNAAEGQARAAYAYAELIGFAPLRAWCRGLQAEAAYWTGSPRRALTLIDSGLAEAPRGTARTRLHSIKARAWSYLGDGAAAQVAESVQLASAARDEAPDSDRLHDGVGGHFSFDPARQARCEATTYVQLGHGAEAAQAAERALELYGGAGEAWRLIELEVHADLAAARLLAGDFDGAEDALSPLWSLPPHERREGLTHRVRQAGALLAGNDYRELSVADSLAERIEDYAATSVVRALPTGTGH
ncbi:MAG: hypothetical protein ACRDT4_05530 [Micromonosporaceae bacterium]